MAAQKFINIVSGMFQQIQASVTGTADAIPAGDATGRLDVSWMPVGIGPDVIVCPSSENLTAGNFINLYNNAGALNARKGDATNSSKPAYGFVLANVTSPANATVYLLGSINTAQAGLTVGSNYWLDTTAGGITATAPSTSGNIVQRIGVALATTQIQFSNIQYVILA